MTSIRAAARGAIDWSNFRRIIRRHGVLGLAENGLVHSRIEVPRAAMELIKSEARAQLLSDLKIATESVRLQRQFDDEGMNVIFLKGTALATFAYGRLGLRSAKDIDILVPPSQVNQAAEILAKANYSLFDPPPEASHAQRELLISLRKDFGFVHRSSGVQVELHWKLFANPYAFDDEGLLTASQIVPITGASALRTLGVEDLFAYLCMHGALHGWNQFKWLADIGALLALAGDGEEHLYRAAERRGVGRAAVQAMRLSNLFLHCPIPKRMVSKPKGPATERCLEAIALNTINIGRGELSPHEVRFGTTRIALSRLLVGGSWRYLLSELRSICLNEADILVLGLPNRLRGLYPLLRVPLWVWRQLIDAQKARHTAGKKSIPDFHPRIPEPTGGGNKELDKE